METNERSNSSSRDDLTQPGRTARELQTVVGRLVAVAAIAFVAVAVWRIGAAWLLTESQESPGAAAPASLAGDGNHLPANAAFAEVQQAADFSLQLLPESAHCAAAGPALITDGQAALGGWNSLDCEARWQVQVNDPRGGFFRASIRYRCNAPVRVELASGDQRLALWSLSPTESVAHEEKFVRITKPAKFSMSVKTLAPAAELKIYGIDLQPRK